MKPSHWLRSPSTLAISPTRKLRSHVRPIQLDLLEPRVLLSASVFSTTALSAAVRSFDGAGNNLSNTSWGAAGTDLIRLAAAAYADGISSPALPSDLSARDISNILNNQATPADSTQDYATLDQNSLSDFGYAFGQFMDHDMDLTPDGGASMPIAVSPSDPIGPNDLPFTRSITDPTTGTSASNPAQQVTTVTAYLDLSQVYGSSQIVADALRTHSGGLLKTSAGNMLPYDNSTYFTTAQIAALNMANDAHVVTTDKLFAAGDRRANENLELTALQTLFLRNHNKIAVTLQKQHPGWSDEQLFQEARKLNIAEYQQIIYTGYLPALLGPNAISKYTGYKSNVNAAISNEFSTVAFRMGHSMLSAEIERQNNDGTDIATVNPNGSDISLAFDFFDPTLLNPAGVIDPLTNQTSSDIGPILKAQSNGIGQQMDLMAVNDIRNLLFGGGYGGEDLMARDVQRERDNGIPDYNTLRVAMGLPAVTSFAQITSNVQAQQALAAAYPGGVNTIDAFEGGLAEDHVKGSDVGPLFQAILVDQFKRLRDGDRFFYLNENFNADEMHIIAQGNTLTEVIEGNSTARNLQADAFRFKASISGIVTSFSANSRNFRNPSGVPGLTVQLLNSDGTVIATTTTDRLGRYTFNQLSGDSSDPTAAYGISASGTYSVSLILPTGAKLVSAPGPMTITHGDTNLTNVNFTILQSNTHLAAVTTDPALDTSTA